MNSAATCYICKSNTVKHYRTVDSFRIYKCRRCGLRWVDEDQIKQAGSFYDREYFHSDSKIGYKDYLSDEKNYRNNSRGMLNIVNKIKDLNKSKVLDIGCAFGFFLDEVKKLNQCDVYGVELSSYAREYAENLLGADVLSSDILTSNF